MPSATGTEQRVEDGQRIRERAAAPADRGEDQADHRRLLLAQPSLTTATHLAPWTIAAAALISSAYCFVGSPYEYGVVGARPRDPRAVESAGALGGARMTHVLVVANETVSARTLRGCARCARQGLLWRKKGNKSIDRSDKQNK